MTRRRKRMKPLLYIDQPEYQDVKTSMQDKFQFNDREQVVETKVQQQDKVIADNPVSIETKERETEETVAKHEEEKEKEKEKEKKPFIEMTIEEKIEYLEQFPVSIVKIQYSFITTNDKIIGYFVSKDEDYIRVIPRNKRKSMGIPIDNILDIKIRGL
jgi:hypothetical protein